MEKEQQLLREKLTQILMDGAKLPTPFSLRKMAKLVDLSPGYLSDFLQGKKMVSPHCMEKIVSTLFSNLNERTELLKQLNFEVIEIQDAEGRILIQTRYSILINSVAAPM